MSKAKKLNKSELLHRLSHDLSEVVLNSGLIAQTKQDEMIAALLEAIAWAGPTTATSTKVNDEGDIFCNYFHTYMPPAAFKRKSNNKKAGKLIAEGMEYNEAMAASEGWQANSINANLIIRKAKSMKAHMEHIFMREFRLGRLIEAELNDMMDIADSITAEKYDSLDSIPTVWERIKEHMGDETANMTDDWDKK